MAGISPALPLTISAADGPYALTKTMEQVTRQNLKTLILTCPGERMMDPEFGVGMRNFLFQQNTQYTYDRISSRIVDQAAIYMSYISIDDIIFNEGDMSADQFDKNDLSIIIKFTIVPLNLKDILQLPI